MRNIASQNFFQKKSEKVKNYKKFTEKELEHYEDTWEEKENEWLHYIKNDVLSSAFCYAKYTMGMEELTQFGMKNTSTLPSLAN